MDADRSPGSARHRADVYEPGSNGAEGNALLTGIGLISRPSVMRPILFRETDGLKTDIRTSSSYIAGGKYVLVSASLVQICMYFDHTAIMVMRL